MVFSLTISSDNDAMQTSEDLAHTLRKVADYIDGMGGFDHPDGSSLGIRDDNGNTVGEWRLNR